MVTVAPLLMLSVACPFLPMNRLLFIVQFEVGSCMLTMPLALGSNPINVLPVFRMEALLMRRLAVPLWPIWMVVEVLLMSTGLPVKLVMSVFIVVPGLLGSSIPTMISAFVFVVGVRRRVVRRVAVVSCFSMLVVPLRRECLGLGLRLDFSR